MRIKRLLLALLIILPSWVPPAVAQVSLDYPLPDSPSGTVYEIPLEQARNDAAPHTRLHPVGQRPTLRSENGLGSSADVPAVGGGAERTGGDETSKRDPSSDADAAERPQPQDRTQAVPLPATSGAPSHLGSYLLIAAVVGGGILLTGATTRQLSARR